MKDFESAIEACDAVLGFDEDHFWATRFRGQTYIELGKFDAAIIDLKKATGLNPKDDQSLYDLATAYRKSQAYTEAAESLKLALEIRPGDTEYAQTLGDLYMDMDKAQLAETAYLSILKNKPKNVLALASLANVRTRLNRPGESEQLLRDAFFNGVNDHKLQLALANCLWEQGKMEADAEKRKEAILILEKLTEMAPKLKQPAEMLRQWEAQGSNAPN